MKISFQYLIIFISLFIFTPLHAQVNIYDDFSKKELPYWSAEGVEMKYSFSEDNPDSGYAIVKTDRIIKPNSEIGTITKIYPYLFTDSSIINIMVKGVSNDVTVTFEILFDIDKNDIYNSDQDIMLTSFPMSMNFNGWKQIKFTLCDSTMKIISNFNDSYSVIMQQSMGIRLRFNAGKAYKDSPFESGVALITEILHPGVSQLFSINPKDKKTEQSIFDLKNKPNPFDPNTTIYYTLPERTSVRLTIYDFLGREVTTLVDETQDAGEHQVEFSAAGLPYGVYFYRLKTGSYTEVKKMVFEK